MFNNNNNNFNSQNQIQYQQQMSILQKNIPNQQQLPPQFSQQQQYSYHKHLQQQKQSHCQHPYYPSFPYSQPPPPLNKNTNLENQNRHIYADDESLDIKQKDKSEQEKAKQYTTVKSQQNYNLEENISFTISSLHKAVKLSKIQTQTIPAMVSVKSKDPENLQSKRLGIDLICIIDKSGSMKKDNKMTSVKKSLNYIIDLMGENDRICLITFGSHVQRILPFKRVTKKNIPYMKRIVNQIQAFGRNNLKDAVRVAIECFKHRKETNYVNSIFLLADGQDPYPKIINKNEGQLTDGNDYTIHAFGYGKDHNPKLMQNIANTKGGSFYYVEDMNTADEFFIDALGGLFSVVGQNLKITIKSKSENKKFSDVSIAKTYGPMWTNNQQDNTHIVKMSHLLCGVNKEFVLDLQIPPIFSNLKDYERYPVLLEGTLEIEAIDSTQNKNQTKIFKASLEMTFYNENENIPPEINQKNEDVELNYLRVQGAQALNDCMKQAESGNFQQAQNIIQNVNQKLQKASNNNQQQLQMLQQDLNKAQQTTQSRQQYYNQGGQKHLLYQQNAHFQQQSMPQQQQGSFNNNNNNYANKCQQFMVQQQQQIKQQMTKYI